MTAPLTLVSHPLCPYVQRAAIVLAEKGVPFERRDVDLAAKPAWFLAISPLGKTPVLLAGGEALFESAAICEYLDETVAPRLHPGDPLQRARHRGWIAFGSSMLDTIGAFYGASSDEALDTHWAQLRVRFGQLEAGLEAQGPFFAGRAFTLVDAVFGPVFRYFEVFESLGEPDITEGLPRVQRWRAALAERPSVRGAAPADYAMRLEAFLRGRGSALSRRLQAAPMVK